MATPEDKMPIGIDATTDCSWCHTSARETLQFSFLWTIKKFSGFQKDTGEFIESSTFSSKDDDSTKFCLRLYPKGDTKENEDYVSLHLHCPYGNFPVSADFKLYAVNKKIEKCLEHATTERRKFESKDGAWGWEKFVRTEYLMSKENGFLQNDVLTIFCEIVLKGGPVMKDGRFNPKRRKVSKSHQTEYLGHLEAKSFSDVVLVTKDGEVPAHKAILALRSPVFAAMFMHDMTEKQTNRVEIGDIDHEVLQEIIRFIYTGKTPAMDDKMATELLAATEKYALVGLKESCERFLSANLTTEKVMDLIPLASLYNANHLKASLINHLKFHAKDDVVNHLWDNLISNHPKGAVEICCKSLDPKKIDPNF